MFANDIFQFPFHRDQLCDSFLRRMAEPKRTFSSLFIGISFAIVSNRQCLGQSLRLSVPFSSGSALRWLRLIGDSAKMLTFSSLFIGISFAMNNILDPDNPYLENLSVPFSSGSALRYNIKTGWIKVNAQILSVPFSSGSALRYGQFKCYAEGFARLSVPFSSGSALRCYCLGM